MAIEVEALAEAILEAEAAQFLEPEAEVGVSFSVVLEAEAGADGN